MCYYNGIKVTREEKIRLVSLAKFVRSYSFLNQPLVIGPNYPQAPMIRRLPGEDDLELIEKEWGFLPSNIQTEDAVANFRKDYITLNAKVENLFTNENGTDESIYAEAAMQRRCLIPSTHFFEYRHLKKRTKGGRILKKTVAQPYLIRLKEQELFYFAGIWNPNEVRGDTWSIVTTSSTLFVSQIHNLKKRMPTILTEELAWEWLYNPKLSRADIQTIGSSKFDSLKMEAFTVSRQYLTAIDPMEHVHYPDVPALGEDDFIITSQLDLF